MGAFKFVFLLSLVILCVSGKSNEENGNGESATEDCDDVSTPIDKTVRTCIYAKSAHLLDFRKYRGEVFQCVNKIFQHAKEKDAIEKYKSLYYYDPYADASGKKDCLLDFIDEYYMDENLDTSDYGNDDLYNNDYDDYDGYGYGPSGGDDYGASYDWYSENFFDASDIDVNYVKHSLSPEYASDDSNSRSSGFDYGGSHSRSSGNEDYGDDYGNWFNLKVKRDDSRGIDVTTDHPSKAQEKTTNGTQSSTNGSGPQSSRDDSAEYEFICKLDQGSISRMPHLKICLILKDDPDDSDTGNKKCLRGLQASVLAVNFDQDPCLASPEAQLILAYSVAWVLAKLNYFIVASSACVLAIQNGLRRGWASNMIALASGMWLGWRFLETLQWEIDWFKKVRYFCGVLTSVRYISEAVMLNMFCCMALERYFALASPLSGYCKRNPVHNMKKSLAIGCCIGITCTLNYLLTLSILTDYAALATCALPWRFRGDFIPVIVAQGMNFMLLYAGPCIVLCGINIAMVSKIRRLRRQQLGKQQGRNLSKATVTVLFILLSSLFMGCCLSKPVLELYLSTRLLKGPGAVEGETVGETQGEVELASRGILLKTISWNLTTAAFVLNALVSIHFSANSGA